MLYPENLLIPLVFILIYFIDIFFEGSWFGWPETEYTHLDLLLSRLSFLLFFK